MKQALFVSLLVSAMAVGYASAQAPTATTACGVDDLWLVPDRLR